MSVYFVCCIIFQAVEIFSHTFFLLIVTTSEEPENATPEGTSDTAEQSLVKAEPAQVDATTATEPASDASDGAGQLPDVATMMGGLAQEAAHQTSLLDMFTQGLFCFSGPQTTE